MGHGWVFYITCLWPFTMQKRGISLGVTAPFLMRFCTKCFVYLMTRTVNAVVCGGILAVVNEACSTLTLNPGRNEESPIRLPKRSKMVVPEEILN